jgi:hypothetical protein
MFCRRRKIEPELFLDRALYLTKEEVKGFEHIKKWLLFYDHILEDPSFEMLIILTQCWWDSKKLDELDFALENACAKKWRRKQRAEFPPKIAKKFFQFKHVLHPLQQDIQAWAQKYHNDPFVGKAATILLSFE